MCPVAVPWIESTGMCLFALALWWTFEAMYGHEAILNTASTYPNHILCGNVLWASVYYRLNDQLHGGDKPWCVYATGTVHL